MIRSLAAALALLIMLLGTTAFALVDPTEGAGPRYRHAVTSAEGVIASVHPLAAEAGVAVLQAGGNAIDAAVAAVLAVGVVRPDMCGIGGGGFLLYRRSNGRVSALDFRESAPAAHEHGPGVEAAGRWNYVTGHNRAGVPGTVAGLHTAWRRFGTMTWSDLVEPARVLAADGFPVSDALSLQMAAHAERLRLYPESASTYLLGGVAPHPPGSVLRLPDYARSLAVVRDEGPEGFYRGAVAEAIAASMAASGTPTGDRGFMTLTDLHDYRAIWRKPLIGTYRDHQVITMPPPTSGGLATLQVLNLLEGYDVASWGRASTDYLHHLAEAQKVAWADRNAFVGDPHFVHVPVDLLSSKAYAAERREEIDRWAAREAYPPADLSAAPPDDGSGGANTTHVSIIDAAGNAVAVTCSIEAPFGSAVVASGTGFLLNGQLADFGAPGTANEPAGGKRPRSSISPTIVVRDHLPLLVTGAEGGAAIPLAVVQQIVGVVDFRLTLAQAIDAERADARICQDGGPLVLCLDYARIAPDVQFGLTDRGHVLGYPGCALLIALGPEPCDPGYHPYAEVQSAGIDGMSGARQAVSDPRGEWGSAGVSRRAPTPGR